VSIFIRLAVVGLLPPKICEITENSEIIRTYSRSRSAKVIDLGVLIESTNYICDFLLVINSDFGRISTVSETLTFKTRQESCAIAKMTARCVL